MLNKNHTDRDAAIRWARELLETDFVILDTETTGLDVDDEAVSIGIVSKTGQTLLYALLRHEKPSAQKALATHGLTWEMTREALPFTQYLPLIRQLTKGRTILAYNAAFDLRILTQTCKRHLSTPLVSKTEDAMQHFAKFYGDYSNHHQSYTWKSLTVAARHFNINTTGAHVAAADALMTLRVVEAMARTPLSEEMQKEPTCQ